MGDEDEKALSIFPSDGLATPPTVDQIFSAALTTSRLLEKLARTLPSTPLEDIDYRSLRATTMQYTAEVLPVLSNALLDTSQLSSRDLTDLSGIAGQVLLGLQHNGVQPEQVEILHELVTQAEQHGNDWWHQMLTQVLNAATSESPVIVQKEENDKV